MSKKRLYEIAKELGKESKEVVARAKELGLDVKSHSSSVEEAVAAKIAASFKPAAAPKVEAKPAAPKASAEKKAEKSEPAKPAVAKEEAKPAEPVAPKAEKVAAKPQSRNFKAEREARAKEQAERRKTETVRKTTVEMVENKVKATAIIAVLTTKLRNSKVSKIVVMSAVNKRINVHIKRLHVLTLKPVQQP